MVRINKISSKMSKQVCVPAFLDQLSLIFCYELPFTAIHWTWGTMFREKSLRAMLAGHKHIQPTWHSNWRAMLAGHKHIQPTWHSNCAALVTKLGKMQQKQKCTNISSADKTVRTTAAFIFEPVNHESSVNKLGTNLSKSVNIDSFPKPKKWIF